MEIDEYSHIHVINPISYHDVTYPSYSFSMHNRYLVSQTSCF